MGGGGDARGCLEECLQLLLELLRLAAGVLVAIQTRQMSDADFCKMLVRSSDRQFANGARRATQVKQVCDSA